MTRNAVQRLMEATPRGQPIDSALLRDLGIGVALAHHLAEQGWLNRLSRGVYLLKGDTPSTQGTLAFLSRRVPGLHVGGKTALAWQGVRHNIAFREVVCLWGQKPYAFPDWVAQYMPYTYQTTDIFDDAFNYSQGLRPLPGGNPNVPVSVPERALLEMASDVGKTLSLEEASHLFVGLHNIRPRVLDEFLRHCHRVKVVRLVRDLAARKGFAWADLARKHAERPDMARNTRWTNRTRLGERLTLKPR